MQAISSTSATLAGQWQHHCRQHPDRFMAICGTPAVRARLEQHESQLIGLLERNELPLDVRGAAFRGIMELRGATARDVAIFLGVEPRVIVLGLSLLELPSPPPSHVAPRGVSRKAESRRTKAA